MTISTAYTSKHPTAHNVHPLVRRFKSATSKTWFSSARRLSKKKQLVEGIGT